MCERVEDESSKLFLVIIPQRTWLNYELVGHHIYNTDRWSRRLATFQINRYWPSIVSSAKEKGIPLDHLGVQVRHDSIPFKIDVYDLRKSYEEMDSR